MMAAGSSGRMRGDGRFRTLVKAMVLTITLIALGLTHAPGASGAFEPAIEGGSISGTVTDSGGAPVADVFVSADSGLASDGVTTSAGGQYTITGLPAGDYRVQFSPTSDSGLIREFYNDTTDLDAAAWVTVVVGETTDAIDAVLEAGGSISGIVTDSNGTPPAGITVNAESDSAYARVTTGADGHYTITGLPAGDYRVWFGTAAGLNLISEYYDDTTDYEAATLVTVVVD